MCDVGHGGLGDAAATSGVAGLGFQGGVKGDWSAAGVRDRVFGGGGGSAIVPSAAGLRAKIAREQWADYKARFQPIENVLLGYANNPSEFIRKNREEALGRVNGAFANGGGLIERRMNSYGLEITPEVRQRIAKELNYNQSLADVQAANMSDRLSKDQLQGIATGGLLVNNKAATISKTKTVG